MEELEFGSGKIIPTKLEHEMKFSYIDYAMSVIVARALPDVRDGLKPVHRRILFAMQEAGMMSNKPYKKSARIVGEVLGKYHPHGDTSVYDAIVRMAQDFSMRYPLADGHGNFGSVDGDLAAAMRYTEVRMSKLSELMLQDIEKDTVDFTPNYDESLKEPVVLPAKFPQLLVNGSSGIAVAMATNIPPHNIGEVIDATLLLIDNPKINIKDLIEIIHGPDFPTAALIIGKEGIRDAYTTGRGSIKMRAQTSIEELSNGKSRIVVTELPYQVNKARLIEKIAELVRGKTIDGITDLRDESDRDGMRIVIELRRDVTPQIILNLLFKHTQLQETFGVIMIALVDGHPKLLNLKEILYQYVKYQKEIITRRTKFDLARAQARAHILEGLRAAVKNINAVIKIVRESSSANDAKTSLIKAFKFSETQAQSILDLRLQKFTGLERNKIESEYIEINKSIERFKKILADEKLIQKIIKAELSAVKEKFNDKRRTKIISDELKEFQEEDLIDEENIVITLTHGGYIKRIDVDAYRRQRRGGIGVTSMTTKEEDFVEHILVTTTHSTILFFTNKGKVFNLKAYQIAELRRAAKGVHINNLLQLEQGEIITSLIKLKGFDPNRFLFMATRKGIVKKTRLSEFSSMMKRGIIAIKLDKGDELINVKFTDGNQDIILGTASGMTIVFSEEEIRAMGRNTRGVRGIKLSCDDEVVGMDKLTKGLEVLTISERGFGKRTATKEYHRQSRSGKGVINMKVTEKTGKVIGIKVVESDQDIFLLTANGFVIRTSIEDIRSVRRNTQGVIVIKIKPDDCVVSFSVSSFENI